MKRRGANTGTRDHVLIVRTTCLPQNTAQDVVAHGHVHAATKHLHQLRQPQTRTAIHSAWGRTHDVPSCADVERDQKLAPVASELVDLEPEETEHPPFVSGFLLRCKLGSGDLRLLGCGAIAGLAVLGLARDVHREEWQTLAAVVPDSSNDTSVTPCSRAHRPQARHDTTRQTHPMMMPDTGITTVKPYNAKCPRRASRCMMGLPGMGAGARETTTTTRRTAAAAAVMSAVDLCRCISLPLFGSPFSHCCAASTVPTHTIMPVPVTQ